MPPASPIDELVRSVATSPRRRMLGLAGPPAAGKSTLARHLVATVNRALGDGTAAYVPLDGFHLSNAQLARIDLLHRKGAPATFDVWGYVALLGRLAAGPDHDVYVPDFDRRLDEPVAARHIVTPRTSLVVTEGNYLALDAPGWREARAHLDELWYVEADDDVREHRLTRRQRNGGKDDEAARAWVATSDRPNGELVKATRERCDRVVRPADLSAPPQSAAASGATPSGPAASTSVASAPVTGPVAVPQPPPAPPARPAVPTPADLARVLRRTG